MIKDGIEEKYYLKSKGLNLEKSNKNNAIEFYLELINNKLFISDYYPYRRLVMLFGNIHHFKNQFNIIKQFFESEIYCNNYQCSWFRNKLRKLNKKGYCYEEDIDNLILRFKNYSLKNKDKANIPVPIAERIQKENDEIIIISQEKYDETQKMYELIEKGAELKRQGKYSEAASLYEYMIHDLGYKNYGLYKELCSVYYQLGEYKNELKVIEEYYEGNSTKTEYSEKWFKKRLVNVKKRIGEKNDVNYEKVIEDNRGYNDKSEVGQHEKSLEDYSPKVSGSSHDFEDRYFLNDEGFYELKPKKNPKKNRKKNRKKYRKNRVIKKLFISEEDSYNDYNVDLRKIDDKVIESYKLAEEYFQNQDFENALKYYDYCINSDSKCYKALNKKGHIFIKKEDYAGAIKLFEKSICIYKRNYGAYLGKAYSLSKIFEKNERNLSAKEWDLKYIEISKFFDMAIELDSDALFFKGKFLNEIGFYDSAISCFNEFLKCTSKNHKRYFKASLQYAYALKSTNKYDKAIECYKKLLKENYKSLEIYLSLGELLFILNKYEESLVFINEFLHYDVYNVNALMYKALSCVYLHKFDVALECYDKILNIDETVFFALLYKFELLSRLHRYSEALDCYYKIPSDLIPECYIELKNYVEKQKSRGSPTNYFSVSKDKYSYYSYQYFYIKDGEFKLYKSKDLWYLKRNIISFGQIWEELD